MKLDFEKMGIIDLAEFFLNGKMILERVKDLTHKAIQDSKAFPICPVKILLLDF